MNLRIGNMWSTPADVYIATGNCILRNDGHVVMGRGAALEMKTMFRGVDRMFGAELRNFRFANSHSQYGLVSVAHPAYHDQILGLFQVKIHYKDDADVDIIKSSVERLVYAANGRWSDKTVSMNFPGIGWGRLKREEVIGLLEPIPDNVTIWELPAKV